jgi:pSer/pThr/pTyr-binding forkhead associated (FHA) protein
MARLILKSAVFADGDIELSASDLPVTLGRSHRADITINDMLLSRIHAEICHGENGGFEIVDHESTNLTIVNNHDIERALLKHGDCILLGETEILVEIATPEIDAHEKTTRELPLTNLRKPADPQQRD